MAQQLAHALSQWILSAFRCVGTRPMQQLAHAPLALRSVMFVAHDADPRECGGYREKKKNWIQRKDKNVLFPLKLVPSTTQETCSIPCISIPPYVVISVDCFIICTPILSIAAQPRVQHMANRVRDSPGLNGLNLFLIPNLFSLGIYSPLFNFFAGFGLVIDVRYCNLDSITGVQQLISL